jgi:hypothetical protein
MVYGEVPSTVSKTNKWGPEHSWMRISSALPLTSYRPVEDVRLNIVSYRGDINVPGQFFDFGFRI